MYCVCVYVCIYKLYSNNSHIQFRRLFLISTLNSSHFHDRTTVVINRHLSFNVFQLSYLSIPEPPPVSLLSYNGTLATQFLKSKIPGVTFGISITLHSHVSLSITLLSISHVVTSLLHGFYSRIWATWLSPWLPSTLPEHRPTPAPAHWNLTHCDLLKA